MQSGIRRRRVG
uniref:S-acyltransferase n=1 Tax=Rhizophora mucronata TaxID=61149 RepID=A0A2P2QE11_RHIMU